LKTVASFRSSRLQPRRSCQAQDPTRKATGRYEDSGIYLARWKYPRACGEASFLTCTSDTLAASDTRPEAARNHCATDRAECLLDKTQRSVHPAAEASLCCGPR
jgi:hypothetical protein